MEKSCRPALCRLHRSRRLAESAPPRHPRDLPFRPEFPDGGQQRDFLYVKDAVAATIALAERADGGGLFNIGSGEPNTWLSLVTPIFSGEPKIDFIDMPESLRTKYQYFTCADVSKLRAAGFTQPFTPLAEAVTDYVASYLT